MKPREPQLLAALNRADPDIRLYLLHGPDEAAAGAHAATLLKALGPDAGRIGIEPASLRAQPGRLADEARSLALFGERQMILITNAGDDILTAVEMLLAAERVEHPVVLIGPGLKGTSKLVRLITAHPAAMVHDCYLPDGDKADHLVTSLARAEGLRTTPSAARRLAIATGADRAIMAREIDKLALYLDAAPERPRDLDDAALDAVGADLNEGELSLAVEATIAGRSAALGEELTRLREAGASPVPLLRSLVRRLLTLATMRGAVEAGDIPEAVVERSNIFWKEKEGTARALRRWRSGDIARAFIELRLAERALMSSTSAGPIAVDHAILDIVRRLARAR